eukprot:gene3035-3316_t
MEALWYSIQRANHPIRLLRAVDQLLLQLKNCKILASHIQQQHADPEWAAAGAEVATACHKYEAFVEGNRALAAKLQRTEARLATQAAAAAAAASTALEQHAAEVVPCSAQALEDDPQRLLHLCRLLIRSLSHTLLMDSLEWLAALEAADSNAQQLAQLQRLEQQLVAAIDDCAAVQPQHSQEQQYCHRQPEIGLPGQGSREEVAGGSHKNSWQSQQQRSELIMGQVDLLGTIYLDIGGGYATLAPLPAHFAASLADYYGSRYGSALALSARVAAGLAEQMYGQFGGDGENYWRGCWQAVSGLPEPVAVAGCLQEMALIPVVAAHKGTYHCYLISWLGINAMGTSIEYTLALIKPDAVRAGKALEIQQLIEMSGFMVIAKKQVQLTTHLAEEFYNQHSRKSSQHTASFNRQVEFLSSGPLVPLVLSKANAIEDLHQLMGPIDVFDARLKAPRSLRAIYGSNGDTSNAVHGSESADDAKREIKVFFPHLQLADAGQGAAAAQDYIKQKLQPTVVKALTVLAREKPTSNKLEALSFLATWMLQNNPNKPQLQVRSSAPKNVVLRAEVKTKEAKPPQEVIDAIQQSEDGSTAPPSAEVLGDTSANRVIASKLVHEEPQKPSDLPEELRHGDAHGNPNTSAGPMESAEKHLKYLEMQQQQQAEQRYDRSHPGAGKAGRGDQQIDGMMGVSRNARKQTGAHDTRAPQAGTSTLELYIGQAGRQLKAWLGPLAGVDWGGLGWI